MWHVAWHVHFQVLNNLENAVSLNNDKHSIMADAGSSYLGEPNSTSFIETRHTELDKSVCIYAVFSHT